MASSGQSVLCVYRYDPLDRLADCSPVGEGSIGLFYQKSHLATQIHEQIQHTLLRTGEHLLAQRRTEHNQSACVFLITDQQQSVIAAQGLAFAYTPYGHRHPSAGPMNLPGFTGQRVDPVTGHYLLGNGYRAFNPVLMRFNSPDSLSPFGEGGLNAYAYCGGDPVNGADPSGHMPGRFRLSRPLRSRPASVSARNTVSDMAPNADDPPNYRDAQQALDDKNYHRPINKKSEKIDSMWDSYKNLKADVTYVKKNVNDMNVRKISPTPEYLNRKLRLEKELSDLETALELVPPPSYSYARYGLATARPPNHSNVAAKVRGKVDELRHRGVWD
ncbi:RHS repeat-associated core domain-containing protein [Pseudomonas syringae pv. tagetis]|uniref:RHS repeat-associated core domain-containing protein n=1 Tax=Pseudomonas syringae pv. tagetis TaxID=129140 RepID=A0A0Q0BBD0_9PSED|nr:RHS repeat-associated core domain-containing protein [Pseudomonas syringae group genomosp. 7]KPY85893.1 Uncharacterized protein ALO44_03089 [Pseudomonas syringae pv. tagetis]RMW14673.1 hypothetical protein ALO98_01616 [Pseudomonas syringae pv. tagetis]RMW28068.1 hypothetical protein ALO97_01229 [Pseudomonas syringae pv. tagetis]UNB68231.1 RHS repeat-associated core domain-containing protein [Pseudomonas syringae pv. tagetis]